MLCNPPLEGRFVKPEPSPENELAVIVPVDEIEPEVIVPVNIGDARGALDDRASLNPLIFDWSIPASDEMSVFEMVASSIFAEVIEPSATEGKFINPEPSPENELAVIVPVDEIEPEVIVPAAVTFPLNITLNASLNDPLLPFPTTKAVLSVSKAVALPPVETEDPELLY